VVYGARQVALGLLRKGIEVKTASGSLQGNLPMATGLPLEKLLAGGTSIESLLKK